MITPSWATAIAEMAWKRAFDESNVSALLSVPSSFRVAPCPNPSVEPPAPPAVVLAPSSTVVVVVGPVDMRLPPATMPASVPELAPLPLPPLPAQMQEAPPPELPELPAPPLPPPLPLAALPLFPFPPAGVVGVVPPLLRVGFTVVE